MKIKKCPANVPNIICFENVTVGLLLFIIIFSFLYLISKTHNPTNNYNYSSKPEVIEKERVIERERPIVIERDETPMVQIRPNYGYTNLPGDVLMNPYMPPVRDERYLVAPPIVRYQPGLMPINVPTNRGAVDTPFRQVGIMTPIHGSSKDNILPLIGRPVLVSRDKWQYYTMSNQNNSIKLPLVVKGRSATDEYGVDKLYDKDHVLVLGQNEKYIVTIYDNDTIRYIPYI